MRMHSQLSCCPPAKHRANDRRWRLQQERQKQLRSGPCPHCTHRLVCSSSIARQSKNGPSHGPQLCHSKPRRGEETRTEVPGTVKFTRIQKGQRIGGGKVVRDLPRDHGFFAVAAGGSGRFKAVGEQGQQGFEGREGSVDHL
jgi:hypothetical protein